MPIGRSNAAPLLIPEVDTVLGKDVAESDDAFEVVDVGAADDGEKREACGSEAVESDV